jgi:hypothetical protein
MTFGPAMSYRPKQGCSDFEGHHIENENPRTSNGSAEVVLTVAQHGWRVTSKCGARCLRAGPVRLMQGFFVICIVVKRALRGFRDCAANHVAPEAERREARHKIYECTAWQKRGNQSRRAPCAPHVRWRLPSAVAIDSGFLMRSISMSMRSPPQNNSPLKTMVGTPNTPSASASSMMRSCSARAGPWT